MLSGSLQEAADLIKPRVIGVKRPAMGLASLYLWIVGALNSSRVVSTLAEITTTAEVAKRVRPETLAPLTCAYPQPNTSLQLLRAFTLLDIGDTKQALDIFTSVMREDPSDKLTLAGLVITTASSDPSQANVYAEHLATSGITRSYAVPTDIEQLGSLHVAHNAKQRTARVKISAKTAASAKKHRNKRRGKLPKNADPNIKPDPERWIPKHMRAGAKRHRKRKGKHAEVAKGPQGSAETAVDALDIAAKSAPQHPSGGASSKPKKKKGGKNKW